MGRTGSRGSCSKIQILFFTRHDAGTSVFVLSAGEKRGCWTLLPAVEGFRVLRVVRLRLVFVSAVVCPFFLFCFERLVGGGISPLLARLTLSMMRGHLVFRFVCVCVDWCLRYHSYGAGLPVHRPNSGGGLLSNATTREPPIFPPQQGYEGWRGNPPFQQPRQ